MNDTIAVPSPRPAPPRDPSASLQAKLMGDEVRPDPGLMTYYALTSLLLGPFFLFALLPMYFRYRTMRYRFDEEGVSMRWGVLFRKEISLTYARIQDIHLTSNVVERWLGLARIQVQTASGSSSAEMTIEGIREFGGLRDFLYSRMRGARDDRPESSLAGAAPRLEAPGAEDELSGALREAARELRALREAIERRGGPA